MRNNNILLIAFLMARVVTGQEALRPAGSNETAVPVEPVRSTGGAAPKISDELRAKAQGSEILNLFLVLSDQIDSRQVAQIRSLFAPRIESFDNETRAVRSADNFAARRRQQAASERDKLIVAQRQEIARQAAERYRPQQAAVTNRVNGLGGKLLERFATTNVLYVAVPGSALADLEADPNIVAVFESTFKQLHLGISTKVLGAPAVWDRGYRGGTQTVAVVDTGIESQHPGFAGVDIQTYQSVDYALTSRCAIETSVNGEDRAGHGTHVSGIVASQGTSQAPELVGVAPGVGHLISVKVGVLGANNAVCGDLIITTPDILRAVEFAVIEKGAKVVNLSLGGFTRSDDQLENWFLDKVADDFDVSIVVAAGNSGLDPTVYQIGDLALSYNALAVANLDTHRTLTRADDTIAPSSSRGPTPRGRRKPDVAAPGTNITSLLPGDQVGTLSGTSMASPHIAGAAALLYDAGARGAKEVKALLLNSTQAPGWSRAGGWGSADVATAYGQSQFVASSTVAAGAPHYYRVPVDGAMRSTLVWNRHISVITPDQQNAFGDFRNLDVEAFDEATNRAVDASTSLIDNVEQIAIVGKGSAIVKVSQKAADSLEEPFAVAFSTGFQEVAAGRLDVQCGGIPNEVSATVKFGVDCSAFNVGSLPLFGVTFRVTAPVGFTASSVPAIERLSAGARFDFHFDITSPATARGPNDFSIAVASIAFGDQLTAKVPMTINIRASTPQDCTMIVTPASGTLTLSAVAQTFVVRLRFPGYNPHEPGVCSWDSFSASPWFSITSKLSGVGDGDLTVSVLAAPKNPARVRTGSFRLTMNGDTTHYTFDQQYGR